jgi:DsbC/DsbD-like thiol-disulfide interchange protein
MPPWFFWLALLFASPALAQLPSQRANAIAPELVAETRAVPGQSVDLAIVMHTRPGWHGYWLNPGDAGPADACRMELAGGGERRAVTLSGAEPPHHRRAS